jgi:hypothetical protein
MNPNRPRPSILLAMLVLAGLAIFVVGHLRKPRATATTDTVIASSTPPATPPTAPVMVEPPAEARPVEKLLPITPAAPPVKPDRATWQLEQAIIQAMNSTNDADRSLVFTNLLPALILRDPAAAGKLAESLEAGDGRVDFMRRVAQSWAATDPAGALAWAANLSDTQERQSTLTDATMQLGQANAASAIATVQQYDLGQSNGIMESLAQLWAGQDLPSALAWSRNLPAGDQRDQALARVAFVEAQTDPNAAASLIVNEMPAGPAQTEAAISVLHQWALRDLPAATAWVQQFPPGPLHDRAQNELNGIAQYLQAARSSK